MEDDPSVRHLLETLLVAEGYDVATASDGLAGLRQAADSPPALMLLDLMMPDLGGVRVLQELGGDATLRDVPVLVLTGKVESVPGLRALLGEESVFVKPFPVGELLARVAAITGGAAGSAPGPDHT